jgi:hypothetical protein
VKQLVEVFVVQSLNSFKDTFEPVKLVEVVLDFHPHGGHRNSGLPIVCVHRGWLYPLLLSRANRVLGICTMSSGGTSRTVVVVGAKMVFATALKANISSMFVAHNQPSGNLILSEQDKQLTKRLTEIGRALDLPLLEHAIVTRERYYSFADEGGL